MSDHNGNGRDTRGWFAKGNQVGKGNPGNRRMQELRRALLDCGTPERVSAVESKLYDIAMTGDVPAIRVWLEHMVGKPIQGVEVSGPDGGSLGLDVAALTRLVLVALAGHPEAKLAVSEALGEVAGGNP